MRRTLIVILGTFLAFTALIDRPLSVLAQAKPECADAEEQVFLKLINDFRKENGLGPVVLSPSLSVAADAHSQDMAKKDFVGHTGSNGSDMKQRISKAGYDLKNTSWGENVFAGGKTAAEAFAWWKNSPGHRANMLKPGFKSIGIARTFNDDSKFDWYWATTFGGNVESKKACLVEAAAPASQTGQFGQAGQTPAQANDEPAEDEFDSGEFIEEPIGADEVGLPGEAAPEDPEPDPDAYEPEGEDTGESEDDHYEDDYYEETDPGTEGEPAEETTDDTGTEEEYYDDSIIYEEEESDA